MGTDIIHGGLRGVRSRSTSPLPETPSPTALQSRPPGQQQAALPLPRNVESYVRFIQRVTAASKNMRGPTFGGALDDSPSSSRSGPSRSATSDKVVRGRDLATSLSPKN